MPFRVHIPGVAFRLQSQTHQSIGSIKAYLVQYIKDISELRFTLLRVMNTSHDHWDEGFQNM